MDSGRQYALDEECVSVDDFGRRFCIGGAGGYGAGRFIQVKEVDVERGMDGAGT